MFLATAAVLGLVACTHNDYMPNVIQLSPSGTAAAPAHQSVAHSFILTAVEDGYTGQFTAQTIVGECWVVQTPVTTGGAWTIVPQGTSCAGRPDTEQIQVKDTNNHSAVLFVRATQ